MNMAVTPFEAQGVIGPGPWQKPRIIGWMFLLLVVAILELGLQSAIRSYITANPAVVLGAAFATLVLSYWTYVVLVRRGEKRPVRELSLRPGAHELLFGLLIGGGIIAAVMGVLALSGAVSFQAAHWTDPAHDIRETLGTGFLEELLARLIVFRLLVCAFGAPAGMAISALLFGAAHLHNPGANVMSAGAIAIEAGLLFSGFFVATGRIWMSVGAHAGWNFTLGALFGAPVSGMVSEGSLLHTTFVPSASAWLTGGSFGPEASVVTMVLGLAAFSATIIVGRRSAREASTDNSIARWSNASTST